jgi:ribosome-associated translation inhibitor RaiA
MRIDVRDRGFKVGEGLRNYVGLRLMSVLDHLAGQVEGVTVRLTDVDVPGDGAERRCRMLARLDSSHEVHVEETGSDVYAAIDRAAERLAHGVRADRLRRETLRPHRGHSRAGAPQESVSSGRPRPLEGTEAPIGGTRIDSVTARE